MSKKEQDIVDGYLAFIQSIKEYRERAGKVQAALENNEPNGAERAKALGAFLQGFDLAMILNGYIEGELRKNIPIEARAVIVQTLYHNTSGNVADIVQNINDVIKNIVPQAEAIRLAIRDYKESALEILIYTGRVAPEGFAKA